MESLSPRKPWIAVVLSLLLTGLGHIYCGRIVKAMVLLFFSLAFYVHLIVKAAWFEPSTWTLAVLIGSALGIAGFYFYAAIDAYRLAKRSGDYTLKDYNHLVVYGAFLIIGCVDHVGLPLLIRAHLFEAFFIPTGSEMPNLLPGDRVLVNKQVYRQRDPRRGEVVVFRNPENRRQRWVKRIVALGGETVEVRNNQVFINDGKLAQEKISGNPFPVSSARAKDVGQYFYETNLNCVYPIQQGFAGNQRKDFPATVVPSGYCFVLGDNRDNSRDSRDVGFVPLGDVLGPVHYIYYPAESWSRFGKL